MCTNQHVSLSKQSVIYINIEAAPPLMGLECSPPCLYSSTEGTNTLKNQSASSFLSSEKAFLLWSVTNDPRQLNLPTTINIFKMLVFRSLCACSKPPSQNLLMSSHFCNGKKWKKCSRCPWDLYDYTLSCGNNTRLNKNCCWMDKGKKNKNAFLIQKALQLSDISGIFGVGSAARGFGLILFCNIY